MQNIEIQRSFKIANYIIVSKRATNTFMRSTLLPAALGLILIGAACGTPMTSLATNTMTIPQADDTNFDSGWKFSLADFPNAQLPDFDDSAWQNVTLPHDWSSYGPFGPEYGSGNGYAPGGIGWYRKHFRLDSSQEGQKVEIQFDGVYDNSEVWINGQFVGRRPYGYIPFNYDLTPFLKFGGENVLSVRVDHSRFADSRWYTGSGIYRHVRLHITKPLHIATWGIVVTTPKVSTNSASVHVETTLINDDQSKRDFTLESDLIDTDGQVVATQISTSNLAAGASTPIKQDIHIDHPTLWSPDSPVCYTVRSRVLSGSNVDDEQLTPFGVRTLKFDPNLGILLNGQSIKLKGVCIHHDAGSIGAAVPDEVLERRLRLLKEMGVNAIRTSHNPPAPEMLDMCDRLGFLVMEEAFDEFTPGKNKWVQGWNVGQPSKFGYSEYFNEWSHRDIQDMVRRDRNHPSVIMWSIGNEIDYANDPFSHPVLGSNYRPQNPRAENLVILAKPLVAAIKEIDQTRPVTAALANIGMSDAVGLPDLLDVVGYNYQESRYAADHQKYPKRVMYGSENLHTYDAWESVKSTPYISGQFLWTGIDYLGEARVWPNRANGAGLLDMCGFKKPLGWFRQSLWSEKPMVYICASSSAGSKVEENWNWPPKSTVSVSSYTNCSQVRLSLNGTDLGTKSLSDAIDGVLTWAVPFQPGALKAEGLSDGKVVATYTMQTNGPADHIELIPDKTSMSSDGNEICHVEFRIEDANGNRIPSAGNAVTFAVSGPATVLGIGNGDLNDSQPGTGLTHRAYEGRGLAILQSTTDAGTITVTATADGLSPATITITTSH
jgi:beta-galactosidase